MDQLAWTSFRPYLRLATYLPRQWGVGVGFPFLQTGHVISHWLETIVLGLCPHDIDLLDTLRA